MPTIGTLGTVVGILDDENDILVDVIWDQPQIGLSNLNSRGPLLRGSVCKFN